MGSFVQGEARFGIVELAVTFRIEHLHPSLLSLVQFLSKIPRFYPQRLDTQIRHIDIARLRLKAPIAAGWSSNWAKARPRWSV
jgi:hypothetical protein